MALITREELELAVNALEDEYLDRHKALTVIHDVLAIVSPEKLMAEWEVQRVLEQAKSHGNLDVFDFKYNEAAIELQIPELWYLHEATVKMKEVAEMLLNPATAKDF